MDLILSFLWGSIFGLFYNEHIYLQAKNFPSRNILYSFWLRFMVLSLVTLLVAYLYGARGVLVFFLGNLVVRFLHTVLRGFVFVRY